MKPSLILPYKALDSYLVLAVHTIEKEIRGSFARALPYSGNEMIERDVMCKIAILPAYYGLYYMRFMILGFNPVHLGLKSVELTGMGLI